MNNKYILTIMEKEKQNGEFGFFWSNKDRKPAGFVKSTTYTLGSWAISLGALYYIGYPKGKKLVQRLMPKKGSEK